MNVKKPEPREGSGQPDCNKHHFYVKSASPKDKVIPAPPTPVTA